MPLLFGYRSGIYYKTIPNPQNANKILTFVCYDV